MKRILIIDDNTAMLELTSEYLLENFDSKINIALNVKEAIDRIKNYKIDLIICDYEMPEQKGTDFLKYLRDHKINIPFILFSGNFELEIDEDPPIISIIRDKNYITLINLLVIHGIKRKSVQRHL